jgi:hypothetical protein
MTATVCNCIYCVPQASDPATPETGEAWVNSTEQRWKCKVNAGHLAQVAACAWSKTTDPTVNDDGTAGFSIGSRWINVTLDKEFVCLDASTGAAVWTQTTASGSTDADAIHDNVAGEIAAITEKATPVSADLLVLEDSADSNNKKRVQIGNLPGGGGGDNISVNGAAAADADFDDSTPAAPAGEVNVKWQKDGSTPNNISASVQATSETQKGVIELATQTEVDTGTDTERAITPATLNGTTVAGIDSSAIHDDAAGEINAITEKASPVGADVIVIEDSAAAYAKKRVQITNLPSGAPPPHATSHQNGGSDEVATATPAANAIPKAGAGGDLDGGWLPYGAAADTACEGNDSRLSDSRTPTTHASSHQNGGSDEIATASPAANAIPKAGAGSTLDAGWVPDGADGSAIHDNQSAEISAVTEKTSPVDADLLLIEDSAASNAKKKIQIGNLPKRREKSITIESPTSSEDISAFFTNRAITISEIRAVVRGSSPSVTWTVRHGTDRSAAGSEAVTGGTTTTSQTTGSDVASFNDATIVADSFVWIETTAQSGTVDELHITIFYDED